MEATSTATTKERDSGTRGEGAQGGRVRPKPRGVTLPGPISRLPRPALPSIPFLGSLGRLPGIRQLEMLRPQLGDIKLPPPRRIVFYVAMGALAAAELIEWPVALAVVAAEAVARQSAGEPAWGREPEPASGAAPRPEMVRPDSRHPTEPLSARPEIESSRSEAGKARAAERAPRRAGTRSPARGSTGGRRKAISESTRAGAAASETSTSPES